MVMLDETRKAVVDALAVRWTQRVDGPAGRVGGCVRQRE